MNPEQLEQTVEKLLRDHGAALRLYAATWSNDPDDCVQQAFIKLATSDLLPNNPIAWLHRVVRNEAISRVRSEKRRRQREQTVSTNKPAFCCSFEDSLDTQELERALAALDSSVREVVVAKIWGGLTFDEIGSTVGCSSSAAHRRYQSGLELLKSMLVKQQTNV